MFVGNEETHVKLKEIVKRSSVGENDKLLTLENLSRQAVVDGLGD
jgi:hypothetical protein